MPHTGPPWKRRFALILDVSCLLLVALAIYTDLAGGVNWRIGGVRVRASSGLRAAALAVIVLIVRHLVVRHPSLAARPMTMVRAVRALVGDRAQRVANAADVTTIVLGAIAVLMDFTSGVVWHVGTFEAESPTGTYVAMAAVALLLVRFVLLRHTSSRLWPLERWRSRSLPLTFEWPSRREWLWASLAMAVAVVVLLRQQVFAFTSVPDFGDPLFSMWRLAWVAHQLPLDPAHLFDGNIFFPEVRTLAYSDAMLVPAVMAAPALWSGAPLVVVYTSLFLFTYFAGGLTMFALARAITGHAGAALVAGFVFAFDSFRFVHYSHLELQFTFWMPLAVLALLRTLSQGRLRDGVATGVFLAAQALSSLYYGAYFGVSLAVLAVGWIWSVGWPSRRGWTSLGVGALIAVVVGAVVTVPYRANRSTVGERNLWEIRSYSAMGRNYFTGHFRSAVYGSWLAERGTGERELFPGSMPIVLGASALVPPFGPLVVPAAIALAASVDASLGLHGAVYSGLNALPPFRGFRVPARFRAIAGMYLALMAGMGVAGLARRIRSLWPRRATISVIALAVLIDLHPTLALEPVVWNYAPDIYRKVPSPHAPIANMPLSDDQYSSREFVYMYWSTFHWHPIVNGQSGFIPARYFALAAVGGAFPADETLDAFREAGTEYFVLHAGYYHEDYPRVVAAADAQPRLHLMATSTWEEGECRLYRLLK